LTSGAPAGAAAPGSGDPKRSELHGKVEATLARLASGLDGASGYILHDLESGETFEKDADTVFPAASTIKLAVFLELYKRAEEGAIDLSKPVPIDPKARVEGGGVLEKWTSPYPSLTALQLSVLMMDFSDNYAANLLIDLVGMDTVGRRLLGWGLKDTSLRRRMMDVAAARAGRENVTTPRELAALLERLHGGRLLGAGNTRQTIDIMKRNEGTPIKRGLPPGVPAADKSGELEGVRACAGLVFVPAGMSREGADGAAPVRPLVISVMTAYLGNDQAGEAFISDVTRVAYDYVSRLAISSEHGRRIGP
jgi:beta-lactamase class A